MKSCHQWFGFPLAVLLAACGNSKSATSPTGSGGDMSNATTSSTTSTTDSAGSGGSNSTTSTQTSSATAGAGGMTMGGSGGATGGTAEVMLPPPGPPGCGLMQAAFCDTFDAASPGGRAGDLDDAKWSVARISGYANQGQGQLVMWGATTLSACGKVTTGVMPPNDMTICAGGPTPSMHFTNSYNDAGNFTIHSYRIRQPFDFTNRTGIITMDVDAKGTIPGGHGFWFNIFISDQPVPAPYQGGQATALFTREGVGIEFESVCSDDQTSNGVSNIMVEHNYKITKDITPPPNRNSCFKTKEEVLNHVEIHISKDKIEVFASDAGEPSTLRSIMVANNVGLGFERGYVNLQHTHYNATKCTFTDKKCTDCDNHACPTLPGYTSYHWDNIGFDGPVFPTPRAYEIPDNTQPYTFSTPPSEKFPGPYVQTGYMLGTDGLKPEQRGFITRNGNPSAVPLKFEGVDLAGAKSAEITLNAWAACKPFKYRFNGGAWRLFSAVKPKSSDPNIKVMDPPFPECDEGGRAIMIPVDLADLKQGDNSFEMYVSTASDDVFGAVVAHVELTVETN